MRVSAQTVRGQERWVLDMGTWRGRRRRRFFATECEARKALKNAVGQQRESGAWWSSLDQPDRDESMAVVKEIMNAGLTLRHVWDEFRKAAGAKACHITIQQALSEALASKRAANRRTGYVTSLSGFWHRFASGREEIPVNRVTTQMVEEWLTNRPPGTRATMAAKLSTLFVYCQRRGYTLTNPCDAIDQTTVECGPPLILTPFSAARCLVYARRRLPKFLPYLVLGMMTGIRPEELDRLSSDAIDLDRDLVTLDADVTKLRQRRIVRLMPAAAAWLATCDLSKLPLTPITKRRCQRKLRERLGWKAWPKDILRHTAASYLLAHHHDTARVALELGHSVKTLMRHYRELVTPEAAERFWGLRPKE